MPYSDPEQKRRSNMMWNRKKRLDPMFLEKEKHRRRSEKEAAMRAYSPDLMCQSCGFSDIRALSIDHVNGDGAEHRKTIAGGSQMYAWLKRHGYPSGFQVLCMNCQWIKRAEQNEATGCPKKVRNIEDPPVWIPKRGSPPHSWNVVQVFQEGPRHPCRRSELPLRHHPPP